MNEIWHSIQTPTLLLNEERCRENIRSMASRASEHGVELSPHFKTHQSADIGNWFREAGITTITVSSVDMAEYFFDAGWEEITIAFPVNPRIIPKIESLAGRARLSLLASDMPVLERLDTELEQYVSIYIEIDTGDGRSGLKPVNIEQIEQHVDFLKRANRLSFRGFYTHPGHSYESRGRQEVHTTYREVQEQMRKLRRAFPEAAVCVGDTPCCSVARQFDGIDTISPGNFVFYDLMQFEVGSCSLEQIAVALAAPVVSKIPERREIIIHGGAVHLSKDTLDNGSYGLPVPLTESGWGDPYPDSRLRALSQEHGILACDSSLFEQIESGDLIGILPVHSCLAADLMAGYLTLDGIKIDHRRTSGE